jgi:UDPglucose 6-dehydrogenase
MSPARGTIAVLGLWHLGCVTAACLAEAGYDVIGLDPDPDVVDALCDGRPPLYEPGLEELLADSSERLRFSTEPPALADADCAWIAFDTPVDDDDRADVEWVVGHSVQMLAQLPAGALVIVSSQLPVGSVAALRERCASLRGERSLRFACIPENLRLGRALESFREPDRIVAGVRDESDRSELAELLAPFDTTIEWMRVESAEMTKHALNGFLATSVAFINETAAICESVGADAQEVARGLKSERRIGPGAYLQPGAAFAGGTLARDIGFLRDLAERHQLPAGVFAGVAEGNAAHKHWAERKLLELLGGDGAGERPLAGRVAAIWGLTYKPGTDTLRRSSAVELCRWLIDAGASVRAHDPAVSALPASLAADVELCPSPLEAVTGAEVLVVCTPWPDYRDVPADEVLAALALPLVLDPAGYLRAAMTAHSGAHYVCVGTALDSERVPHP